MNTARRNPTPSHSPPTIPRRQRQLRDACLRGDISAIQSLLEPYTPPVWIRALRKVFGAFLLRSLGLNADPDQPVALDCVYCDDNANLPIHYIASGRIGFWERITSGFRGGMVMQTWVNNAGRRAHVLDVLLESPHAQCLNLSAVNSRLETPLHCSLRSCSAPVTKALIEHGTCQLGAVSPRLQTPSMVQLDAVDGDNWLPLDVAVTTSSWFAVSLLIKNNAHMGCCPGLQAAEERLSPWTSRLPVLKQLSSGKPMALPKPKSKGLLRSMARNLVCGAGNAIGYRSDDDLFRQAAAADTEDDASSQHAVVYADCKEVVEQQEAAMRHVAAATGVGDREALALLRFHGGDPAAAVGAHEEDSLEAMRKAGVALLSKETDGITSQADGQEDVMTCIICFDELPISDISIKMQCSHVCCDECWRGVLAARLSDGDVHRTCCPAEGCLLPLTTSDVQLILADNSDFERYVRLLGQKAVDLSPNMQWCPQPGCGKALGLNRASQQQPDEPARLEKAIPARCGCGQVFCWSCRGRDHSPASCDHMHRWGELMQRMMEENEETTKNLLRTTTQECPRCQARIEKTGGCNHMICSICKHNFCWMCLGPWSEHSNNTGGYYVCNRYPERAAASSSSASSSSSARSSETKGLFNSLLRVIQQPFETMRLSHYMRRHAAHDQVQLAALTASARKVEAILKRSGLPINAPVGDQRGGVPRVDTSTVVQYKDGRAEQEGSGEPSEIPLPSTTASYQSGTADRNQPDEQIDLLHDVAEAVADGHRLLANSYILGYFMAWGSCRTYFEDLQGVLEQTVESLSMPLAMMPTAQEVRRSAHGASGYSAVDVGVRLPLTVSRDGAAAFRVGSQPDTLQCRQFYHALVLHKHRQDLLPLLLALKKQCAELRRKAQCGVFARAC